MSDKRLIEEAFPLKQASIDSVHEKNVRSGHISSLHLWPARRPLAACRAALIAALLPDPGDAKARQDLVRRIGGELVIEGDADATRGGVLRWGRENSPDMDFFRREIRKAFDGRAPKVLDMFAGGGAIPLEAMRLGCDVTAVDYNPVAWFILKCTLDYPSRFSGKRWPLPSATLAPEPTLRTAQGKLDGMCVQPTLGEAVTQVDGDLAMHVRYWGNWVLERARKDLTAYYPTLPLVPKEPVSSENPLCPTVAYLWARTVPHPDPTKNGLQVPLLKTLWLCKKAGKKRALKLQYNGDTNSYDFAVFSPRSDEEVGSGTMSRQGVQAPPTYEGEFGAFIRSDYLQRCGKEGKMSATCTAVVVDVRRPKGDVRGIFFGKEYRMPTEMENEALIAAKKALSLIASKIPAGLPSEPLPPKETLGFRVPLYGIDTWDKLYTTRQLVSLGTLVIYIRKAKEAMADVYRTSGSEAIEAITAYLACGLDRLLDFSNCGTQWKLDASTINHSFDYRTHFA